ncbi:hypothetical protein [Anoxybacillus sp. J5B_2022]|nr:hypothetical protein [Anoxybacillus sp. J5B_2022]MCZ0754270.1 hypothetical protein [Anoxybacillus sp. J5B_2022]
MAQPTSVLVRKAKNDPWLKPRKHPTDAQAFDEDVRARRTAKAKAEATD